MNGATITILRNCADELHVAEHLRACDARFVPTLSSRVDIDAYAARIVRHAERFEAWSDQQLAGLVAAYCNDAAGQTAFVTSVSVLPRQQGSGIASRLLQACIDHVGENGFERIELEVDASNSAATLLYQRRGFAITRAADRLLTMQLSV